MLSIGTNAGAIMAQSAAYSVTRDMETAMHRLSTGKRINAAADDAAGVAISSRLDSSVRGLKQSIRNALDAQALVDTAEGAMQEIESILQRIRQLSIQAANDTNSADDLANLNAEAQSLLTEIDRISSSTTWAGQSLLDGTFTNKSFQVSTGAISDGQLVTSIAGASSDLLSIKNINLTESNEEIINFAATDSVGVTVKLEAGTYKFVPIGIAEGGQYDVYSGHPSDTTFFYEYTVTATELGGANRINFPSTRYANPRDAIDNAPSYEFTLTQAGSVNVSRYDNPNDYGDNSGGLSIKLVKPTGAKNAISLIDTALQTLNSQRGLLGAISNRLDHIVANNTNVANNIAKSLGRIQDADYAAESTSLGKNQILLKASTAMLAQANASKQNILELLQN
jgi:flagellin